MSHSISGSRPTVATAAVDILACAGVRTCYTVPGESFLGVLEAWDRHPDLMLVSTRHESGAAFMGEAEAKLTGRPALVLVSRGPGAANAAIGVHTGMQDQTPMVVLIGQVHSAIRGREGFQEVDLERFYAPITKWAVEARRSDEVAALVKEAASRAVSGRPGPVAVAVPVDFWAEPAVDSVEPPLTRSSDLTSLRAESTASMKHAAEYLVQALEGAERPIVIAGPGNRVGRAALREASERFGFGVYAAFRRQDVFDENHPHFLGHLRSATPDDVLAGLDAADLIVVLGTRLDAVTSQGFRFPRAHQEVIIVGPGLRSPQGHDVSTVLDVDVEPLLRAGLELGQPRRASRHQWAPAHETWMAHKSTASSDAGDEDGLNPGDVVRELSELSSPETVVASDAGSFAAYVHRFWWFTTRHRQLAPSNGAMGYGVPAAVAAALSCPERPVVAFVGDGGLMMTGQEIETGVRLGLKIVVVAFQNGLYGTIALHQRVEGRPLSAVRIGPLDLAAWASALGADGFTIERRDQVAPVLRAALAAERLAVIDVRVDPDQLSPGSRLSHLAPADATQLPDN